MIQRQTEVTITTNKYQDVTGRGRKVVEEVLCKSCPD